MSGHKRAVQTIKRLTGQSEIGLRFRPLPTKMCVLVCTDSALHNADADPDEEGLDDEWLAKAKQKGVRVRKRPKTIGTHVGTNASTIGRRADEIIGRSLPEKRPDSSGTAQLQEESTKVLKRKQIEKGSGGLEQKDWWQ